MSQPDFNLAESKIAVIGLGLMGGSLALGLRGKCAALFGCDPHLPTLELALSQHIVDHADSDPATLLSGGSSSEAYPDPQSKGIDLIILATPVPAILTLLEQLPSFTSNPCIVMDLGSTKKQIVDAMSRLPQNFDPIGAHPICGKEKLSLANAERTLYYAAPFLLTPLERTSPRALSAAHQIIEALGAKAKILDADEHDRILASTSHFPFVLASSLALSTPQDVTPFVGPGFKSASRLAGTPSSMMLGVLQSNRDNVLNALHNLQSQLAEIESALENENYDELENLLNQSRETYLTLTTDHRP
jgi:prephenate dehydrogenase